jgi:hypothetical protein
MDEYKILWRSDMGLFNIEEIKKMRNNGNVDYQVEQLCIEAVSDFYETAQQVGLGPVNGKYVLLTGESQYSNVIDFNCTSGCAHFLGGSIYTDYLSNQISKQDKEKIGKYLAGLCRYNQKIGEMLFERAFRGDPLSISEVQAMVKSGNYS